jgi:hypothetical protein
MVDPRRCLRDACRTFGLSGTSVLKGEDCVLPLAPPELRGSLKTARSRTTCLISDDPVASDGKKASEVDEVVRDSGCFRGIRGLSER